MIATRLIVFNVVFFALFAAAAGSLGYFAKSEYTTVPTDPPETWRNTRAIAWFMSAGMCASVAGGLSAIMCLGELSQPRPCRRPWFVPFVLVVGGAGAAGACGALFHREMNGAFFKHGGAQAQLSMAGQTEIIGFTGALTLATVATPWLGSAAMTWLPDR